jgi:hypothetical protein
MCAPPLNISSVHRRWPCRPQLCLSQRRPTPNDLSSCFQTPSHRFASRIVFSIFLHNSSIVPLLFKRHSRAAVSCLSGKGPIPHNCDLGWAPKELYVHFVQEFPVPHTARVALDAIGQKGKEILTGKLASFNLLSHSNNPQDAHCHVHPAPVDRGCKLAAGSVVSDPNVKLLKRMTEHLVINTLTKLQKKPRECQNISQKLVRPQKI